MTTKPTKKTLG